MCKRTHICRYDIEMIESSAARPEPNNADIGRTVCVTFVERTKSLTSTFID